MNAYRTFEVNDVSAKLKGVIQVKDNEKENSIMAKLRKIGFKINKKKNKVVWWHEDYVEIINKRTEETVGFMELCYR